MKKRDYKKVFNTGKSIKPSPKGDGQSKALSSFSCPKKSKDKRQGLFGRNKNKYSINLKEKIFLLPLRYFLLLIIMIFGLPIIYYVLTPLTIYSAGYIIKIFYSTQIIDNLIIIDSKIFISIIAPCVAGSAYLLLLILNLTVPLKLKKRIYSIILSFLILFLLNVLRIVLLSILLKNNSNLFDFSHKLFWYSLSTLFVVFIWFLNVKIFSIKEIPVYSDIKSLLKVIKKPNRRY